MTEEQYFDIYLKMIIRLSAINAPLTQHSSEFSVRSLGF